MKDVGIILAMVVTACILGCRDAHDVLSASHPNSAAEAGLLKHDFHERLPLTGILHVPGQYNEFDELSGEVEYNFVVLPVDPIPPYPQFRTYIDISVSGNLKPWGSNGPVWEFSGTARSEIEPTNDESVLLSTRYWVAGAELWFVLTLRITERQAEVYRTLLELPRIVRAADEH